jgi:23S rRNA (pseudouridine1915-N3)-methyltransferase
VKVLVVVVGKARGPVAEAVAEYERRAARYWRLEIAEVGAGASGAGASPAAVRAAEAERLLARVPTDLEVVALTRPGKGMSSRALARYLEGLAIRSSPGVAFLIGGAHGLDASVLERARRELSLSTLTLPHEMARLFLAEQLYRAGTIIRGEPYHKG